MAGCPRLDPVRQDRPGQEPAPGAAREATPDAASRLAAFKSAAVKSAAVREGQLRTAQFFFSSGSG